MYKLLIFLSAIWLSRASLQCSQLQNLSEDDLWIITKQSTFQKMFNLIVGSISILGLLALLASYKVYASFSIPSDIMFSIAICQLIQNTSILASASYFTAHENSLVVPDDFDAACISIGIFAVLGNIGSLIYNLIFCLILSFSIKKTLRGSIFDRKMYHSIAILTISSSTLAITLTSNIGRGLNGLCGYRMSSKESISKFIVDFLICFCCIFSMIMFRNKIPKNTYFKKVALFGYYFYYMGIFSFIQFFNTTAYMIGNIACRSGYEYSSNIISVSLAFGNSFSLILSFVLILLRFSHPILRLKIRKLFSKKNIQLLDEQKFGPDEDPWLGCLLQSIKGSQIISFISGILIGFAEHQYKIPQNSDSSSTYLFNKNYIAVLNQDITDQYVLRRISNRQSNLVRQKLEGLRALDYQVTVYSIGMFAKLISKQSFVNVFKSFDINTNIPLIKKQSNFNGGKSGQFFFKTHDQKFILKTIREDEAHTYLEKISEFYAYYQANPMSLIAKIFGLYKFVRKDISEEPIYLIIMKNLSPVDSSFNQRVYDIKGSEFNRSTINEKQVNNQQKLRKLTLKDLDFKKLEGKVIIGQQKGNLVKKLLKNDAQFLGSMGVIDYSVLIIKRKGPLTVGNQNSQFRSLNQQGIIFNIGVIDYLQSWTLKRKAERAFKMMITRRQITVSSPTAYSTRFTSNLEEIF